MKCLIIAAVVVLTGASAAAQEAPTITSALVGANKLQASVTFSTPVAPAGAHLDPHRAHLTGAPGIEVTRIERSLLESNVLSVVFSDALPPGSLKICFDEVAYPNGNATAITHEPLCAPLSTDLKTAKDAALKVLTDTPVPDDERKIFASGFVTSASKDTEGGAVVSLNPKLSDPNASVFFRLKKSTVENGDPKSFETGVSYHSGIPWNRAQLAALRDATDAATINRLLSERQKSFIAGSVLDIAAKLEGEPTNFDAVNGVADADYQIRTMTRRLTPSNGFWRAYVMPAGTEIGRKLGVDEKGAATANHDWIVRYKAGAGLTLYYDNPETHTPLRRVSFDVNGVWRYLGVDELQYNKQTKALDKTTKGGHGYVDAGVKVFVAETSSALFGVRASFTRGALAPAFAHVDSVQFGFLLESKNDKQ